MGDMFLSWVALSRQSSEHEDSKQKHHLLLYNSVSGYLTGSASIFHTHTVHIVLCVAEESKGSVKLEWSEAWNAIYGTVYVGRL